MTNLDKKLKSYSLLATGVLAFGGVQAQINYVDIDPDQVVNRNQTILVNMNNAGKAEFAIQNRFEVSSSSGSSSVYNMLMIVPRDSNEFLGVQSVIMTSSSSTYLYVPKVMAENDIIGPDESYWYGDSSYGLLYANVKQVNSSGSFSAKVGKWLNKEDGYVGVRFTFNGDTDWHYGWIRLSVPNDSTIIVKDFAYETHLGKAIKAGQTYSAIDEQKRQIKLYATAKNLVIIAEESDSKVFVYNTTGQLVMNNELKTGQNQFNLGDLPSGYYVVKVVSKDVVFTEKIMLK